MYKPVVRSAGAKVDHVLEDYVIVLACVLCSRQRRKIILSKGRSTEWLLILIKVHYHIKRFERWEVKV